MSAVVNGCTGHTDLIMVGVGWHHHGLTWQASHEHHDHDGLECVPRRTDDDRHTLRLRAAVLLGVPCRQTQTNQQNSNSRTTQKPDLQTQIAYRTIRLSEPLTPLIKILQEPLITPQP